MYKKITGSVAAGMLESAVDYCRERMGCNAVLNLLKEEDAHAVEYFRYGLAQQIGAYLGGSSESIKEVYLYPDTLEEDPALTLPLTLIVHVAKHSAALDSVMEALQRALLEEYRHMFSPLTENISGLLHVYFVDETDLSNRRGMAICINSIHKPALRVWSR